MAIETSTSDRISNDDPSSLSTQIRILRLSSADCKRLFDQESEAKAIWTQDTDEVVVSLTVKRQVTPAAVQFTVHPKRLDLVVDGTSYLTGSLENEIDVDGSYWYMDDSKETETTKGLMVVLMKKVMGYESFARLLESDASDTTITDRAVLSIQMDGSDVGRFVVGLFGRAASETVEHFMSLVEGRGPEQVTSSDTIEETLLGAEFREIYGGSHCTFRSTSSQMKDPYLRELVQGDARKLKHDRTGLLTFDPEGELNDFSITLGSVPDFDEKRIVFGEILHGLDLLVRIEGQGDEQTGVPMNKVTVSACAEIMESEVDPIVQEETERRIFGSD